MTGPTTTTYNLIYHGVKLTGLEVSCDGLPNVYILSNGEVEVGDQWVTQAEFRAWLTAITEALRLDAEADAT